jgi:hypothetical protein
MEMLTRDILGNSGKSAHLIYFLKFLGNGAEEEVGLKNV